MKTTRFLLAAIFGLALAFTFSCSGGDNGGNTEQSYSYCITADGCLPGPFTTSTCTGQLSNGCPNGSSPSEGSSSSSIGDGSSSSVAGVGSSSSVKSNSSSSIGGGSSSSVASVSSSSSVKNSSSSSVGGGSSSSATSVSSSSSVKSSSSSSIGGISSSSVAGVGSSSSVAGSSSSGKGNDIANYRTVKIGEQVWMAENLNYAVEGSKCANGSTLSNVNTAYCDSYGRLYDWVTAMSLPSDCNPSSCASQIDTKHRGICPSGWHIPSDAEWTILTDFTGGGVALKATSGWNYYDTGSKGQDTYGFTALPGGYGHDGKFSDSGKDGYWYASNAYYRRIGYALGSFIRNNDGNGLHLYNIRCLQD